MKTDYDIVKLVEGKNLQYMDIYILFGYKVDVLKDEEFKINLGNKIDYEIKKVAYMKRDPKMDNYKELKDLETEYYNLFKEEPKKKFNILIFIFLLLLLIIPGIIYYKSINKKPIKKDNTKRINEIFNRAKEINGVKYD